VTNEFYRFQIRYSQLRKNRLYNVLLYYREYHFNIYFSICNGEFIRINNYYINIRVIALNYRTIICRVVSAREQLRSGIKNFKISLQRNTRFYRTSFVT